MKNDLNVVLQKPEPFIAPESQIPVSNDELELYLCRKNSIMDTYLNW